MASIINFAYELTHDLRFGTIVNKEITKKSLNLVETLASVQSSFQKLIFGKRGQN